MMAAPGHAQLVHAGGEQAEIVGQGVHGEIGDASGEGVDASVGERW
jgi:hypothetical protein